MLDKLYRGLDKDHSVGTMAYFNSMVGERANIIRRWTLLTILFFIAIAGINVLGPSFPVQYDFYKLTGHNIDSRPRTTTSRQHFRTNNSELLKYEQELYSIVPEKFNPDFKAPCWYTQEKQLMCLPYFYIAGFPKCGTTDLWFKIVKHPDIISVCKEPHWWAWKHYGVSAPTCAQEVSKARMASGKLDSSIESYLQFYNIQGAFSQIAKSNGSSSSFHPKVFCDASVSTSYGTDGSFFSKYNAFNELFVATIPELLHSVTPNANVIFILRDPVDRYYSGYQYSPFGRRRGTPSDFHRQAVDAVECFQTCLETYSLYYCGHHLELCKMYSHAYLDKLPLGMYSIFIADWLHAFPRKQLHFLTLNQLRNNPETTMKEIFRFLELPPFEGIVMNETRPPANSRSYADMLPETRQLLQDFYRPFDTELVKLLKDEKFSFSSLDGLK